jgi:hypothetical protein
MPHVCAIRHPVDSNGARLVSRRWLQLICAPAAGVQGGRASLLIHEADVTGRRGRSDSLDSAARGPSGRTTAIPVAYEQRDAVSSRRRSASARAILQFWHVRLPRFTIAKTGNEYRPDRATRVHRRSRRARRGCGAPLCQPAGLRLEFKSATDRDFVHVKAASVV